MSDETIVVDGKRVGGNYGRRRKTLIALLFATTLMVFLWGSLALRWFAEHQLSRLEEARQLRDRVAELRQGAEEDHRYTSELLAGLHPEDPEPSFRVGPGFDDELAGLGATGMQLEEDGGLTLTVQDPTADVVVTLSPDAFMIGLPESVYYLVHFDGDGWEVGFNVDGTVMVEGNLPDDVGRVMWDQLMEGFTGWQEEVCAICCEEAGPGPVPPGGW